MPFPLELAPHSSRLMMAGLVVGHLVLGLAFLASSLPPWAIGLACLSLAASAFLHDRRWRQAARLRFILGQDGAIQVIPLVGPAYEARAGRGCRDLGWAVWLAWQGTAEGGGKAGLLMLPRDAVAPEVWRALRIWLRFCSGLSAPDVR